MNRSLNSDRMRFITRVRHRAFPQLCQVSSNPGDYGSQHRQHLHQPRRNPETIQSPKNSDASITLIRSHASKR
ncbi:hypothetical protein Nepgr_021490 [Nepenthes gracilis]|uniref:Uncharacterized protein n=1 Tax=Nepenthes gracilis TaxID=150966 RepID=A0AAD3XX29_NEPGR|nr:hypothetical protein Nepgr_021490 [Nepenthes gracilis]